MIARNFLAVQWLQLSAFTAIVQVWSLVKELRSHNAVQKKKKSEPKRASLTHLGGGSPRADTAASYHSESIDWSSQEPPCGIQGWKKDCWR